MLTPSKPIMQWADEQGSYQQNPATPELAGASRRGHSANGEWRTSDAQRFLLSAHTTITATVAHTFLSTIFLVLACPTKSRTSSIFIIIVTPVPPPFDINTYSIRPDIHPLGELDGMLLRDGRSGRECAAGNNRDAHDNPVHDQSFPRRNRLRALTAL
jgi:hypothetical protein